MAPKLRQGQAVQISVGVAFLHLSRYSQKVQGRACRQGSPAEVHACTPRRLWMLQACQWCLSGIAVAVGVVSPTAALI